MSLIIYSVQLTSHCCVIRSVYHACEVRPDQYLIMKRLERNVPYGTLDLGLIRLHDIQILTAEPPQWLRCPRTFIYTFKPEAIKSPTEILIIVPSYNIDSPIKPAKNGSSGSL